MQATDKPLRIALVHPWLGPQGGGERVVDILAEMFPEMDIFTIFRSKAGLPPHVRPEKVRVSLLDKFAVGMRFTFLLPLFPWAVEQLDMSAYDVVISSCGMAVMGVNVNQHAVHICYMHTPQRTWWDQYAQFQAEMPWLFRQIFAFVAPYIRMWEFSAMQRVDHVISNSEYIAQRVFKYFRRQSVLIYPPVSTSQGYLEETQDDYYLSLCRLVSLKRIDLVIRACNQLGRRLVVAGAGPAESELKAIAGPTIEFAGRVPDEALPKLYAKCRAFIFAADEDFGIAPVEVQAYGRPVIAYGHGGSLETVRVGDPSELPDTGVYFPEQTVESVVDGILRFEAKEDTFIPAAIREHARQFDEDVFKEKIAEFIDLAVQERRPPSGTGANNYLSTRNDVIRREERNAKD